MVTVRMIGVGLAAALLAGCATAPANDGSSTPRTTRSLDLEHIRSAPDAHRIGRSALLPGQPYISADGHANAVVLLSKDTSKSGRNAACEAFVRMPSATALEKEDASLHVLRTYWPLRREVDITDCKQLVRDYDYERAQAIASRFRYPAQKGPALAIVQGDRQHFLIDMSKAKSGQVRDVLGSWLTVAMEKGASGETTYVVSGASGGNSSILGELPCKVLSIAGALDIPVTDIAGQILCKKDASREDPARHAA